MKNFDITAPSGAAARKPGYVLVTPVKDEESLIVETIASVVSQSCQPLQWVIVDDGSTDRTASIVSFAAARHPWIRLVCLPKRTQRSFAAVVHATEAGLKALSVHDYQYIGLLDADLRFAPDYFEQVIARFEASPGLGLGGGHVVDLGQPKTLLPRNRKDVPGAAQFFRRQCFEELGGLVAIPEGGWDALTCLRARMLGYETRLFTDLVIDHLKPRNVYEGHVLRRIWQLGVRDYALGSHPLFEVFKCMSRVAEQPIIIGAVSWLAGYFSAALEKKERYVPDNLLRYYKEEQFKRLRQILKKDD
jgi:glycosyltransferase involved in cell wall biosynthesis